MIKYYLGIIVGTLLSTWVKSWEYSLIIIFLSLLMILCEMTIFANVSRGEE